MSRLASVFEACKAEGRAALVGYLTAGDPDLETSEALLMSLAEQVDVLEIGMPFSDPMADGPVIQAASERALSAGTHIQDVFALAARVRARFPSLGIVLMGYANTPYSMGFEVFANKAVEAGVDGVLLVDIPPEEASICEGVFKARGLEQIFLLSPTSSESRIKLVCTHARGFIYYVSLTGITGADMGSLQSVQEQLAMIRRYTDLPVCVGFGVKTPEQAQGVVALADGVVVGSHFVMQITDHADHPEMMLGALSRSAAAMRAAVAS